MKTVLRVAGVFVGTVIGAGYASGQEILQFFVSHGLWGIAGTVVTILILPLLGYQSIVLGSKLQVSNHKKVVYHICGKYLGSAIDIAYTFFLFGIGAIMIAASGSLFEQSFGIAPIWGYLFLTICLIFTLLLNTLGIFTLIGAVTPYIFALLIIIVIYSLITSDGNIIELESTAKDQLSISPNWFISAVISLSFNFMVGFAMMIVAGGKEKDQKNAKLGAIIGGVIIGFVAFIIAVGVYANIDLVQHAEMPTIMLAAEMNPIIGILMAIGILAMIYNSAVSMFYTFVARFFQPETKRFKTSAVIACILGLGIGFMGFVDLVNTVYPLLGYIGFIVIVGLIIQLLKTNKVKNEAPRQRADG